MRIRKETGSLIFQWNQPGIMKVETLEMDVKGSTSIYGQQNGENNPAIPLLGIYPEKTIIRKDTCTPFFIAALFAIARLWKQPKCPSTEEWIQKMWYTDTMEYYSAIKKNKIMPFAVDGPRDCHTE